MNLAIVIDQRTHRIFTLDMRGQYDAVVDISNLGTGAEQADVTIHTHLPIAGKHHLHLLGSHRKRPWYSRKHELGAQAGQNEAQSEAKDAHDFPAMPMEDIKALDDLRSPPSCQCKPLINQALQRRTPQKPPAPAIGARKIPFIGLLTTLKLDAILLRSVGDVAQTVRAMDS